MDPSYNNGFGSFGNGDAQQTASPTPSGGVGMQPQQPAVGGGSLAASGASIEQGDIIIGPPVSKKRFNGKIIALIGAVVAVVAILMVIILNFSRSIPRSEVYSTLWSFYYESSYRDLALYYDGIVGKTPHLEDNSGEFLLSETWIKRMSDGLESSRTAYEELAKINPRNLSDDEREEFNLIVGGVKKTMDVMESNISVVSDFYNVFIASLSEILREDGGRVVCERTEEISALMNNSTTRDVAEKYYLFYCKIIEKYQEREGNGLSEMDDSILELIGEAANSLDKILNSIDNDYVEEIEQLLDRLSQ